MSEEKDGNFLGQRNRRTATILIGWIALLAFASILVIVMRH